MQKKNHQRVNVFLDGEFSFGLTRIVAAWLQVGMELSEEKIAELMAADEREVNYQRTLRYTILRPRTQSDIKRYLSRRKVSEEVSVFILERLKETGLVNDQEFAENWVENRSEFRPRSKRALEYELRRRGIESEIIKESTNSINEGELAYQAAQRHEAKIKHSDWREFRQKMLRFLAQRGFDYPTSSEACQRVWDEKRRTEQQLDEGAYL